MSDTLNMLEQEIVQAEDSAEGKRWAQAREVMRLLDAGATQREVAASWINGRTGQPYDVMHVNRMAKVGREFVEVPLHERPPFTVAYDKAANSTTTRVERTEAQAPRSETTARKLVENILDEKTPPEVRRAISSGLVRGMSDDEREEVVDTAIRATAQEATAKAREHQTEPTLADTGPIHDRTEFEVDVLLVKVWRWARELRRLVETRGVWVAEDRFDEALQRAQEAESALAEVRAAIEEAVNERSLA